MTKIKKPRPFGFPAWIRCKRRVAKKYFNRWGQDMLKRYEYFHDAKIGETLIGGCACLNERPTKAWPQYYRRIGKKIQILHSIVLKSPTNTCDFFHCGVEPPYTLEQCEKLIKKTLEHADRLTKEGNKDGEKIRKHYEGIELLEDGTYRYRGKK